MYDNNNMADAIRFTWDETKRQENINKRGLDIAVLSGKVFEDQTVIIRQDTRKDYDEDRYLAYGVVDGVRLCVCFTPRDENTIHLITIFKVNKRDWEKYHG